MNDAINLSWTTFSTVGYGAISPSTSAYFEGLEGGDIDGDGEVDGEGSGHKYFTNTGSCAIMGILLSFESLVGILFVSFAGALLFVKLIQFQSNAQVKFSTVMIVKYGDGVEAQDIDDINHDDEEDEDEDDSEEHHPTSSRTKKQKEVTTPCPILIFRIVNLLNSSKNGEIVNAHVNTVATVDLKNAVMSHITRTNAVFRNALSGRDDEKRMNKYRSTRAFNSTRNNRDKDRLAQSLRPAPSGPTLMTLKEAESCRAFNSEGHIRSNRFWGIARPNSTDTVRTNQTMHSDVSNHTKKTQQLRSSMMHLGISTKDIGLEDEDVLSTIKSTTGTDCSDDEGGDENDDGEHYVSKEVKKEEVTQAAAAHLSAVLGRDIAIHKEAQVEMPNLVFAKVIMTPSHHPYFRTSWRVVHTLNEESPLLSKTMRKQIKENNGFWPRHLYTPDIIRENIDFDQFLVSFRGLSKSSGSDVYAHQVYTKENLRVGYQFSSILVQNPNGTIGVEADYIDDIKEQEGGRNLNLDM